MGNLTRRFAGSKGSKVLAAIAVNMGSAADQGLCTPSGWGLLAALVHFGLDGDEEDVGTRRVGRRGPEPVITSPC
jgi:hypothetical protein